MQAVTTVGLDIAKSVFQVHGVDEHGKVVVRRQLKRRYVLAFFKKLSPAWWGSRPAPPHIIGRGSCRHSATPSA
jgi:transposase